jgi:endoglucanase
MVRCWKYPPKVWHKLPDLSDLKEQQNFLLLAIDESDFININPKETSVNTLNFKLSACAISVAALLSACGGGGTIPDTTAPTVTITDNISAASLTSGDVTFTFTFSEEAKEFTAEDITVTGGTKGAFNMATNGLTASLVVTPTANTLGSIDVSVAASKFKDVAGNLNTATASGSQAYNTVVAPPPTVNLVTNGDFSSGSTGWTGNAANVRTNESFNFADVTAAGNPWDVSLQYVLSIPTSGVSYKLKFKAWSNTNRTLVAGIGLNSDPWTSTTETVNLTTAQQTFELNLTSNFASANSRIIFDMGGAVGQVLIDDVVLEKVNDGPTTAALAPTATAGNVKSIFSDTYTNVNVSEWGPDWGPSSARITADAISGNNFKLINMAGGQVFAGISFAGDKFDASSYTHFNIDYWVASPILAGQVISLKLSNHDGANGETSAIEHVVSAPTGGSWQRLSVPLSSFTQASNSLSRNNIAQLVISAARADTSKPVKIYIDNVYFSK